MDVTDEGLFALAGKSTQRKDQGSSSSAGAASRWRLRILLFLNAVDWPRRSKYKFACLIL